MNFEVLMSVPIIIYSADKSRGGILHKILNRNGLTSLWENRLNETQAAVLTHHPDVFIADIKNALKNEIVFLANICLKLQDIFLIVIGGSVDISTFDNQVSELVLDNNLRLTDPLSPELIVSKVKEVLSSRENALVSPQNNLETDLKQFLKL
jgi:DNA-binding NtrC family response regulator